MNDKQFDDISSDMTSPMSRRQAMRLFSRKVSLPGRDEPMENLFDDISRIVASPMPRRRALKLIATALVSSVLVPPRLGQAHPIASNCCGNQTPPGCTEGISNCIIDGEPAPPQRCCEEMLNGSYMEHGVCNESLTCVECIGDEHCGGGQKCCSESCVNTNTDQNNCGSCGNQCTGVDPGCCSGSSES
jgi:hypothetical protein